MKKFSATGIRLAALSALCTLAFACSDGDNSRLHEEQMQKAQKGTSATGNNAKKGSQTPSTGAGGTGTASAAPGATGTSKQDMVAVQQFDFYVVGIHPMVEDINHQMIAHHFCKIVNENLSQCVLFNDNTKEAHMNGIEYIISESAFNSLSDEEKKSWHPHNYEILSGTLVAPGMSDEDEKALMKKTLNSYGKTFQLWMDGDAIPVGAPMLAWSLNHEGEAKAGLLEDMAKKLNIDINKKKEERADLVNQAQPQEGVNFLSQKFGLNFAPTAGVMDKNDAGAANATTGGEQPAATGGNAAAGGADHKANANKAEEPAAAAGKGGQSAAKGQTGQSSAAQGSAATSKTQGEEPTTGAAATKHEEPAKGSAAASSKGQEPSAAAQQMPAQGTTSQQTTAK